jgi:capsular exopolysaccharide synthesis family protein
MVAANLAITLAQSSIRVLLVDADLRRPSLPLLFGLKLVEGLAEILQGRAEFMALCRRIDPLGLFLLPAGRPPANPVELLQGDFMRGVVKTATSTFDWVVIDSPPVLPLADGRFLGALSDAVVLVVREGHTRREELHESLVALKGAPLAGIILNTSRSANLDAYAYYYPALPKSAGSKRPALAAQLAPNEKISNRGPVS